MSLMQIFNALKRAKPGRWKVKRYDRNARALTVQLFDYDKPSARVTIRREALDGCAWERHVNCAVSVETEIDPGDILPVTAAVNRLVNRLWPEDVQDRLAERCADGGPPRGARCAGVGGPRERGRDSGVQVGVGHGRRDGPLVRRPRGHQPGTRRPRRSGRRHRRRVGCPVTAAEMQAIAPAPEGCEWVYEDGAVVLSSGRHRAYIELDRRWFHLRLQAGSPAPWTSICTCAPGGIDALLALRRLAGHIWPWPGWPVVEGVRPAGWGPRPTADERTAHRATGGSWLWRRGDNPVWQVVDPDTVGTGQFCAIDRDGRWVDVDTRGQG